MRNIVKDIKANCKDHSVEGIVRFLFDSGDFSYNSEYDREIFFFYRALIEDAQTHREARKTTIEVMKISNDKFRRAIRKFRK